MEEPHTDWFREHLREQTEDLSYSDENISNFEPLPRSTKDPGMVALDLVSRTVDLIGEVENCAAEKLARADSLAHQAIEKLKEAEERVHSAESAQRAAEAEVRELNEKLQEFERALQRTTSRMTAAEARLARAEQRAKADETRANQAEDSLRRIEELIRTKIFEKRFKDYSGRAARAA